MSKVQKKLSKKKLLIPIILILFLFSIFKIGTALASTDSFTITSAEICNKSSTADINSFSFEDCKIINNVTFHQVGDSITYRFTVKNNEETSYTIKSVSDDNENKYISYIYDSYEGTKLNSKEETTFEITEKYVQAIGEMSKRNQSFSVNITFTLEDEQGNVIETTIPVNTSSNPKTGDNVGMYIATSVASLIMLILLSIKRTVSVKSSKIKQIKTKSRNLRTNASIMNCTIQTNEFNDISNIEKASKARRTSRKHKGKHYGKHSGNGFKLFSLFIVGALILPTIAKATTNYAFAITFENNIALKDKLIVSYTIGDENYNITTRYNELIPGLVDPEIDGYDFVGWELKDGTDFNPDTTKITDDITLVSKFEPKTYTISYDLNGGTIEENPTTFTIETNDIVLNIPTKEGYTFAGWTGTELNGKVENVTIAKGSTGNREYTANWTTADYTIEYNLNGGTSVGNPTTYTMETDDITLNKPTKYGYTFEGWTGTELQDKTEDVTIVKGSKGNREYTANWTPTNYTIIYTGLTEDEENEINNPTTYNIETPSTTLNNPEDRRDSYNDITQKFVGWKENTTVSTNITIPIELGNKEYEAVWVEVDPNVYTVEYDLDGGTVTTANRTSFTKFDTFTLNNPAKQGYDFIGWTGSNGTTPELTVTIPTGTRENLNYTANWTPIEYTISCELDGGTVIGNPTSYTIESDDITLNNPTKEGYTFLGWLGTDLSEKTMEVTIPKGSIGSKEYTANWTENTYTIIFDRNTGSGSMANQEMTYTVEESLNTNEFTKIGYTFNGWNTKADGTGTTYTNGQSVKNLATEGEITLYAKWQANTYTIIFNKNDEDATGTMENQQMTYDVQTNLSTNGFTKAGCTFVRWNTKADGTGAIYTNGEPVTNLATGGEITLYAEWQVKTYSVVFNKNNDNATGTMEPQEFIYGEEQELSVNSFSLENYEFIEWNTEPDGSGCCYYDEEPVINLTEGETITLYAQWDVVTYWINYSLDGGTVTGNPYIYNIESNDIILNNPIKTGYDFKGWSGTDLTGDTNTTVIIPSGSTGDRSYTANYTPHTYYIKFNANGGYGTMSNQTMTYGTYSQLSSNTFHKIGYGFSCWNTQADGSGTTYTDERNVRNLTTTDGEIIDLYAQWVLLEVKYAVQIYGINQDVDINGDTLGLTFGAAIGASYRNAYVTHDYEETSEGSGEYYVKIVTHTVDKNGTETLAEDYLYKNGGKTEKVIRTTAEKEKYNVNIHEMTWAEIKAVSDKTIFTDCMLCGDTKSIKLTLNNTIASENVYDQYGDGAGVLKETIKETYLTRNPNKAQNSYVGTEVELSSSELEYGSTANTAGAYSSSHIRATLIGENEKTNKNYAGDDNLTEDTCLYSCLESDVKAVITPKKVKYSTGTKDNQIMHDDIADSIWLFSCREMYGAGEQIGNIEEGLGNDNVGYDKFGNAESRYYMSSYNNSTPNSIRKIWNEDTSGQIMLRSIRTDMNGMESVMGPFVVIDGTINSISSSSELGLTFGFCIK